PRRPRPWPSPRRPRPRRSCRWRPSRRPSPRPPTRPIPRTRSCRWRPRRRPSPSRWRHLQRRRAMPQTSPWPSPRPPATRRRQQGHRARRPPRPRTTQSLRPARGAAPRPPARTVQQRTAKRRRTLTATRATPIGLLGGLRQRRRSAARRSRRAATTTATRATQIGLLGGLWTRRRSAARRSRRAARMTWLRPPTGRRRRSWCRPPTGRRASTTTTARQRARTAGRRSAAPSRASSAIAKNKKWASCLTNCTKGSILDGDPKPTPWDCEELGAPTPLVIAEGWTACSPRGQDCRSSNCCTGMLDSCYMKNAEYGSCMMECDPELQGQLRAAEVSRSAAEQRAATSEAALERTLGDLSARRRRAAAAAAPPSPGAEEDVEALRNEVVGATATLGEMTATLSRKEQLVEKSDREHSEVKRERDALASANESLRKEVEQLRGQIDAEEHSAKGAEAELSQLWAQLQRHEVEFARDMEELKKKAWSTEDALRQCRAALDECESSAEAFRGEGAELRSSVVAARASLARAEAEEEDAAAGRRRELAALGLRERELRPGRTRLLARLDGLVGEAEQLRQQDADRAARAELGQAEAAEECAGRAAALRAREAEAAEVERRVAELMQHMQEQRRENSELACEVSIAREAAAEVGRAPWAAARPPGAPAGCRAAAALQAQREVDLLQRWKSEALSVLGRMQGDMSAAQEQYRLGRRELQGQLELLGRSARATLACPASARAQKVKHRSPWTSAGVRSARGSPAAPAVAESCAPPPVAATGLSGESGPGLRASLSVGGAASAHPARSPSARLSLAAVGGAPLRGPDVPERPAAAAPGPAPQGAAAAACLPAGAPSPRAAPDQAGAAREPATGSYFPEDPGWYLAGALAGPDVPELPGAGAEAPRSSAAPVERRGVQLGKDSRFSSHALVAMVRWAGADREPAVDPSPKEARRMTVVLAYFPRRASDADLRSALDAALGRAQTVRRCRVVRDQEGNGLYGFFELREAETTEAALAACARGAVVLKDEHGHTWHIRASRSERATVGSGDAGSRRRHRGRDQILAALGDCCWRRARRGGAAQHASRCAA
ncbi:unnamed protein product, partial [Prorocentrum cordatum]